MKAKFDMNRVCETRVNCIAMVEDNTDNRTKLDAMKMAYKAINATLQVCKVAGTMREAMAWQWQIAMA